MINIIALLDYSQPIPKNSVWREGGYIDFEVFEDEIEPPTKKIILKRKKKIGDISWKDIVKDSKSKIKPLTKRPLK